MGRGWSLDAHVQKRAGGRELVETDQKYQYWVVGMFRRHPALLVSVFYVVASFVGMLFAWDYLRHFGINVFHFAQVSDFLMASLKEPITWVIVLLTFLGMLSDNALSRRWQQGDRPRMLRWYGSPRYRLFNYVVFIGVVVFLIDFYARTLAERTIAGGGDKVSVRLADSEQSVERTLLGTTGTFIFVFDAATQQATALPIENVASISGVLGSEPVTD